jgi:hypothetical protein
MTEIATEIATRIATETAIANVEAARSLARMTDAREAVAVFDLHLLLNPSAVIFAAHPVSS